MPNKETKDTLSKNLKGRQVMWTSKINGSHFYGEIVGCDGWEKGTIYVEDPLGTKLYTLKLEEVIILPYD